MTEKDASLFEGSNTPRSSVCPVPTAEKAFFEHQVQAIIWAIAFKSDPLGGALGRLSTIETKFPERFELLKKLAKVRGLRFDQTLFDDIKRTSGKLVWERNLLAHGTWAKHPKLGWLVREIRGEWGPNVGGPSGPKKVRPSRDSPGAEAAGQRPGDLSF
jgi:hypothetical protein